MNLMMSNCFALPTPADTILAAAPSGASATTYGLMGAGIVVLIVLIIRRISRPEKSSLKGTPGRHNNVNPAMVLMPLLVLALVSALLAKIFHQQLGAPDSLDLQSVPIKLTITLLMQLAWLAASLTVAYFGFPLGLARGLGLSARHWIYDSLRAIVAVLAVLPLTLLALSITQWLMPEAWQNTHEMLVILKSLPDLALQWKLLLAFSAIVLAPVTEEIFFRGLCQSVLRKYLNRPWAAILITSALFATMHAGSELPAIPALMILAIVLGYNYERTGRLWAPILIHALFNAISITSAWRAAD